MTRIINVLTLTCVLSGAALAATAQETRVLKVPKGLCSSTIASMTDWAAKAKPNGAFVMPTDNDLKQGECNSQKMVVPSVASGYATLEEAMATALAACEAARTPDFGPCRVFGELVYK